MTGISNSLTYSQSYIQAIRDKRFKRADAIQRVIESRYARLINAKLVQGKLGQQAVVDYQLNPDSKLLGILREKALGANSPVDVEFKALAGPNRGTTIGQITIKDQKNLFIAGELESFSAQSVKEKIFDRRKNINESSTLIDLDTVLAKDKSVATVTKRVFNFYFKKDERFKRLVYAKVSTMLLNNIYNINGVQGTRLVGLQLPFSKFNAKHIKVKIEKNALVFSINDSLQRELFKKLDVMYQKELREMSKPVKRRIGGKGNSTIVEIYPLLEGTQVFGAEVTNSVNLRPSNSVIARIPQSKAKDKPSSQKFISGTQWTVLVQQRLGQTMSQLGNPEPPMLKERSGRFRTSVAVYPDFRNNLLKYTYNPLYASLEQYGYDPDLQVETSIREVSQRLYARAFNIVKV